jgi:hypothetical protein
MCGTMSEWVWKSGSSRQGVSSDLCCLWTWLEVALVDGLHELNEHPRVLLDRLLQDLARTRRDVRLHLITNPPGMWSTGVKRGWLKSWCKGKEAVHRDTHLLGLECLGLHTRRLTAGLLQLMRQGHILGGQLLDRAIGVLKLDLQLVDRAQRDLQVELRRGFVPSPPGG